MIERTANLLGVVSLTVAGSIEQSARDILNRAGETPAAIVVIGYGFGPSNEQLRRILGLSHPGSVRLVDRLVADGLAERRQGDDRRSISLHLTQAGEEAREKILRGRIAAITPFLGGLSDKDRATLDTILHRLLASMGASDLQKQSLCRLCDESVCVDCPIPADFRKDEQR